MPVKRDEAAGGLVVARDAGGLRVALIATNKYGTLRWALPKGHFKKKETAEQAALREVREETGLQVELLEQLSTIDYWFVENRVRYHKFVHYYLMRAVGGSLSDHDDEVVEARWFEWNEALRHMAFSNERELLERHAETVERALDRFK